MSLKRKRCGTFSRSVRALESEPDDSTATIVKNINVKEDGGVFVIPSTILKPNFSELAKSYTNFNIAWGDIKKRRREQDQNQKIKFQNGKSSFSTVVDHAFNVALTQALLDKHFQLSLPYLPEGFLCPPVPNRLNYVLWIKRLLKESTLFSEADRIVDFRKNNNKSHEIDTNKLNYRGIDLGTGVSAIYPLLLSTSWFSSEHTKWKILGTDIDEKSVKIAQDNVKANNLQHQIHIQLVNPSRTQQNNLSSTKLETILEENDLGTDDLKNNGGPIQRAMEVVQTIKMFVDDDNEKIKNNELDKHSQLVSFDFCMTNPPFYGSEEEAMNPRAGDGRARADMTKFEGTYPNGGEVGFVLDMIRDSFFYGDSITWYSSMVGKKSSLITIEKVLKKYNFGKANLRTTDFIQGKTRRWGIAWTFKAMNLRSIDTIQRTGRQDFEVHFEGEKDTTNAMEEVSRRFLVYCESLNNIRVIENETESQITLEIRRKLDLPPYEEPKQFYAIPSMPKEGDFLIDVTIAYKSVPKKITVTNTNNASAVLVQFSCYSHSFDGASIVSRISSQIQGEICRTNRKWRRILSSSSSSA